MLGLQKRMMRGGTHAMDQGFEGAVESTISVSMGHGIRESVLKSLGTAAARSLPLGGNVMLDKPFQHSAR